MTTITPAFIVKQATAAKTGPRSKGGIGYQVLCDANRTELMLIITGNEGGGYFSHEVVPFQKVIDSLKGIKADQPFAAKTFKTAFKGKSANNSGFMAAILRAEGLIGAAPEAPTQHVQVGDWKAWRAALLAAEGVPYVPPAPKTPDAALASGADKEVAAKPASASAKGKAGKARKDAEPAAEKPSSTREAPAHENPAA